MNHLVFVSLGNFDGSIWLRHRELVCHLIVYNTPTGEFDDMGVAEGSVDAVLGLIKSLRLSVHVESDNWAILSEVRM